MRACKSYWEIASQEMPAKSLRDHVRQRIYWVKTPNRKNVGQVADVPRDFVKAAAVHLADRGLLPELGVPTDPADWEILLDAVVTHLGVDYAKFCQVLAPRDLEWTLPETATRGTAAEPAMATSNTDETSHAANPQTATEPGEAAERSALSIDIARGPQLTALLDQLRALHSGLVTTFDSTRHTIDDAQLIDLTLVHLCQSWNSTLAEIAMLLHGRELFLVGFDALEKEVDRIRKLEQSRLKLQEALAEKTAKLEQFETKRADALYADDTDYRAFVEDKVEALQSEISQLDATPGDAHARTTECVQRQVATLPSAVTEPIEQPVEDNSVSAGPADENLRSPHEVPNEQADGTDAVHGEHVSGSSLRDSSGVDTDTPGATLTASTTRGGRPEPGKVDDTAADSHLEPRIAAAMERGGGQNGGLADAAVEDIAAYANGLQSPVSKDNDSTLSQPVEAGLATLITRDAWASASALAAISDLDADSVQALNFCAESFSLEAVDTDALEILEHNVEFIVEAAQSSPTAKLLTTVGLLRLCMQGGKGQFYLNDDLFDSLPGQWPDTAREMQSAVVSGYRHLRGHDSSAGSVTPPTRLKQQAEELRETLPKRGNKLPRARSVLRQMMESDGELALALDAVSAWVDGTGDLESIRIHRANLADPRKLIDRIDADLTGSKQKKASIVSTAYESLAARIGDVTSLLDRAVDAAAADDTHHAPTDGQLAERVRNLLRNLPKVELDDSVGAAALERLRTWLTSGSRPTSGPCRSFAELKFTSSLAAASAVRDENLNLPMRSLIPVQSLIDEVRQPKPVNELLPLYLDDGNLAAAAALGAGADNSLAIRTAERQWRHRINERLTGLQADALRLQAQTQVTPGDQATLEARISGLRTVADSRFDVANRRADEITAELEQLWATSRDEMGDTLRELGLTIGVPPQDIDRINALIDENDFVTAREFISILASPGGQPLPREYDDGPVSLREFRELLKEWPHDAGALEVVEAGHRGAMPDVVVTGLRAWNQGGRVRKAREWQRLLPSILTLIGLEKIPDLPIADKTGASQNQFAKFTVKAKPRGVSYITALGSRARLRGYTVYAVMPDTPIEALFDQIPAPERREANIVFYPGLLTWDQRRQLRGSAEKQKITALTIDSAVIAYMASQKERTFKTLQRITLPFSIFAHWAPRVAGDVPDELFVGRAGLIDKIISREGSIFVYGGRQLGKSALLHRIERDFNKLDKKLAIYIDFKVERIGEESEPEHFWTVLRNRLKDAAIIPATSTSTKSEAVVKAIRDWLEEDPDRSILLLCDETDAFLQNEARERLANHRATSFPNVAVLKGLMDATHRRFKPVFAGLHQVQRIADTPNSPLAHGGEDILVGPLEAPEAWDLVVRPFKALGFEFESLDLVWRLLAFTNYHPGLVQIVCYELYERMRPRRIAADEPPYIIHATDVDEVITSRNVRDFIAERFRLTIQLEDRYFVIAMVIALLGFERGFEERYAQSEILEFCGVYWSGGFDALTEIGLSVYLDEMVGLGVLVRGNDDKHYGLRSPNVVHILGDRDKIEKQLDQGRFELPLQYNARDSRRRISAPRSAQRYSPLSEYELSILMPKRTGVRDRYAVAVIGSSALGIDKVREVLTRASKEDYEYELVVVSADDSKELVRSGTGVIARRPLVVCDAVGRPECLDEIVERIGAACAVNIGRRAVLLGPSGASAQRDLNALGVEVMPLQLWRSETVRAALDSPITDPLHREEFVRATGGWPLLCERYLDEIRAGETVSEVIKRAEVFPDDAGRARTFLTATGLTNGRDLALLGSWAAIAEIGDVIDEDTLGELLDIDLGRLSPLLESWTLLSIAAARSGGYLLNEVVRRALIAVGAADAS